MADPGSSSTAHAGHTLAARLRICSIGSVLVRVGGIWLHASSTQHGIVSGSTIVQQGPGALAKSVIGDWYQTKFGFLGFLRVVHFDW